MKRKSIFITLFLSLITIVSFCNNDFLTKDISRSNPGYKALDWFIIENKTPDILSYSRDKTLSSYRFTMLTVEIIQKINDFDKKVPDEILNILEDLIPQFSNEIRFLYGEIIHELNEKIKNHRRKTGRIKRVLKPIKRKKIGVYSKPETVFKSEKAKLEKAWTWMFQKETWEKSTFKDEYNNRFLNFSIKFKLKNTPIIGEYLSNDLFSEFNTSIRIKNNLRRKSFLSYFRYEDELKGTDSYSLLQKESHYFLTNARLSIDLSMTNTNKKNDDSSNYYFTGFESNKYSISLSDISDDNLDSTITLSYQKKDMESFTAKTENVSAIDLRLKKVIYGKFFNNLIINNKTRYKMIDTDYVNLYSGEFLQNRLRFTLPITISDYILTLTNSNYKADQENSFDYSYKEQKIDLTRFWYNLPYLDIWFQISHQDFTPDEKVPLSSLKNNFSKKYYTLSATKYFNTITNLNISITAGEKSFRNQDINHSNFRFFSREIGLYVEDYVLSYSALDKRFDLQGVAPKQVHYDIGVYYAKNW